MGKKLTIEEFRENVLLKNKYLNAYEKRMNITVSYTQFDSLENIINEFLKLLSEDHTNLYDIISGWDRNSLKKEI